jgi:hypothetical protein
MRGKTPEEPADLARGRPTRKTETGVSEVQPGPTLVVERGRRTREARGAAERGRGQHVSPRAGGRGASLPRSTGGAGDRRAGASRKRLPAGSLPDGDANGSIDRTRRRIVGSRPHGRSTDLANMWPGDELSRVCAARVRPDHVHPRVNRAHGFPGASSRGDKPRRAPTRRPCPGQGVRCCVNGLSRRAKLRSGRPGCRMRRARPIRDETP